jgi:hypothetical protein
VVRLRTLNSLGQQTALSKQMLELVNALDEFARFPVTQATKESLLSKIDIPTIMLLLDDDRHSELTCRALCKMMPESTQLLREQGADLWLVGLGHRNFNVRKTTLEILSDLALQEGGMDYMSEKSLLPAVFNALSDKELKVSKTASDIVLRLSTDSAFCSTFFEKCRSDISKMIKGDDTISQLRALELLARIWSQSPQCSDLCRQTGAKETLLGLMDSEDCLLQLNAVEILSSLPPGEVPQGPPIPPCDSRIDL